MAIKISISSAKRLGYSIKGYVFDNTSKVPIPVIEKTKVRTKRGRVKKESRVKLIDNGIVCKLNLKDIV